MFTLNVENEFMKMGVGLHFYFEELQGKSRTKSFF